MMFLCILLSIFLLANAKIWRIANIDDEGTKIGTDPVEVFVVTNGDDPLKNYAESVCYVTFSGEDKTSLFNANGFSDAPFLKLEWAKNSQVYRKPADGETLIYNGFIYKPEPNATNVVVYQAESGKNAEFTTVKDQLTVVFPVPLEEDVKHSTVVDVTSAGDDFVIFSGRPGEKNEVDTDKSEGAKPIELYNSKLGIKINKFVIPSESFYIQSAGKSTFKVQSGYETLTYPSSGFIVPQDFPGSKVPHTLTVKLDKTYAEGSIKFKLESFECDEADAADAAGLTISSPTFNFQIDQGSLIVTRFQFIEELSQFDVSASCDFVILFDIDEAEVKTTTTEKPQSTSTAPVEKPTTTISKKFTTGMTTTIEKLPATTPTIPPCEVRTTAFATTPTTVETTTKSAPASSILHQFAAILIATLCFI